MTYPPADDEDPLIDFSMVPDDVAETLREVIDSLAFRSCYDPVRVLGAGSFGVTLLGRQRSVDRPVAIKILHNLQADSRARFQREARILSGLRHSNVIHMLDFDAVGDSMFMVMEFVEGLPLDGVIRPGGLPWPEVRSIALQVLAALEHVHGLGILHRDLKPANIFMDSAGKVRVLDFGMVSQGLGEHRLTRSGIVLGTPGYMAPEVLCEAAYSPLSDIYAFGVVLYELLTGTNPFVQETVAKILLDQMSRTIEDVPSSDPDLPPEVRGWVLALLRKEPELRPSSATRLLEIFEAFPDSGAGSASVTGDTMKLAEEPGPPALPSAPPALRNVPPLKVVGEYEVLGLLGRGGMGVVYRARKPSLEGQVALKIMRQELRQDHEMVRRFRREIRIHSALTHPNLVQVLEIGEADDVPYLALELVEGETLRARLRRADPLSFESAVSTALRVAEALMYLHERDIRHRDLKPENVFLGPDGAVKVGDFGLAAEDLDSIMTRSSMGIGTPAYAPPELVERKPCGKPGDLHALGVLLFEMITGRSPFQGKDAREILEAIATVIPPPVRSPSGSVSKRLNDLVQRLLQKDPALRPDAPATVTLLRELHERRSARIHATPTGVTRIPPAPRWKRLALPVTIVTVLALAGAWLRPPRTAGISFPSPGEVTVQLDRAPGTGRAYWLVPASGAKRPGRVDGPALLFDALVPGRSYHLVEGDVPGAATLADITVPGPAFLPGPHGMMDIHWKEGLPPGARMILRDRTAGLRRETAFGAGGIAHVEGLAPGRRYEVEILLADGRRRELDRTLDTPQGVQFHNLEMQPHPWSVVLDYDLDRPAVLEVVLEERDPARTIQSIRTDGSEHGRVTFSTLARNRPYLLKAIPTEGWGGIRRMPFVTSAHDELSFMTMDGQHLAALGDSFGNNSTPTLIRHAREQRGPKIAELALARMGPTSSEEEKVQMAGALMCTGHPRAGSFTLECLASVKESSSRARLAELILQFGPRAQYVPGLRRAVEKEKDARTSDSLVRAMVASDPAASRDLILAWLGSYDPVLQARGLSGASRLADDPEVLIRVLPALSMMSSIQSILAWKDPGILELVRPRIAESPGMLWAACLLGDESSLPAIVKLVGAADAADRLKGVLALGVLCDENQAATLATILGDQPALAEAAAWSLARLGKREAIQALVARAVSGKDRSGVACWALGELGATGSTASLRSHLAWLMGRADPADRFQACLLAWTLARLADRDALELLERMEAVTPWGEAGKLWASRSLRSLKGMPEAEHLVITFPFSPPFRMREELSAGTGFWASVETYLEPTPTQAAILVGGTISREPRSFTTSTPGWALMETSGQPMLAVQLDGEVVGDDSFLQRESEKGTREGFLVLKIQR